MVRPIALLIGFAALAWFLWRVFWKPVLTTEMPPLDAYQDPYNSGIS